MERDLFLQILSKRGYTSKSQQDRFLNPDYARDCHDPYLLNGMHQAVSRILRAIKNEELIVVYGDYDVDGLCASSIFYEGLRNIGCKNIEVYIPDRFREGYGINKGALKKLAQKNCSLLITVDCGTNAFEEIEYARTLGLDVIITDHHSPRGQTPNALAVVNPKLTGNKYPFRDLAGCGVAFKVIQALYEKKQPVSIGYEKWLLDLVAIGTVCDIVDLKDENRCLVYWGIEVLKKGRRPGIKELIKCAGFSLEDASSQTIGFKIGPRLNASGRIENAKISFRLLTTENTEEAKLLAIKLEQLNAMRVQLQSDVFRDALEKYTNGPEGKIVFLHSSAWHQGVIGIVASKLMEHTKKPVFIFQTLDENQIAKGSIRSFGDFNVSEAIKYVGDFLISGGGHKHAGGCSLKIENLNKTKTELEKFYCSLSLKHQGKYFQPGVDINIQDFQFMTKELLQLLQKLEPYGVGNREPVFSIKNYRVVDQKKIGSEGQHLKGIVSDRGHTTHNVIGFNRDRLDVSGNGLCFNFENNIFNGKVTPQLKLV